jgi:hypothetical protein
VKERLLDAVVPMNYTICHKTFRLRVERDWAIEVDRSSSGLCTKKLPLRKRPKHPKGNRMAPEQFVKEAIVEDWAPLPAPAVIMGTSVESGDCRLHQKQLALALQRFGHFSVFCYSSLFSPVSLPRLLSFFFLTLETLDCSCSMSILNHITVPISC